MSDLVTDVWWESRGAMRPLLHLRCRRCWRCFSLCIDEGTTHPSPNACSDEGCSLVKLRRSVWPAVHSMVLLEVSGTVIGQVLNDDVEDP